MVELFRYIEQSFLQPASKDNSVNLEADSEFQNQIRRDQSQPSAREKITKNAQEFIDAHFAESPPRNIHLEERLLKFHHDVLNLKSPTSGNLSELIQNIFNKTAQEIIVSDHFKQDKAFITDSIVAVKLITAFDRVNAADLVAMRQVIEFLTRVGNGGMTDMTPDELRGNLLRPMRIPLSLFPPKVPAKIPDDVGSLRSDKQKARIEKLQKEASELKATYEALMAIHADDLEVVPLGDEKPLMGMKDTRVNDRSADRNEAPEAQRSVVALSTSRIGKLDDRVIKAVERMGIDVRATSLRKIVATVKEKWINVSKELEPYLIPSVGKVYQLGIHTFAVKPLAPMTLAGPSVQEAHHD